MRQPKAVSTCDSCQQAAHLLNSQGSRAQASRPGLGLELEALMTQRMEQHVSRLF